MTFLGPKFFKLNIFWVALFGTEVVAGRALFGTSTNLVAEPTLFGTVRKNILVA